MTPERWQKIEELFEAAILRSPQERRGYLELACSGDAELRGKVEELLASDSVEESSFEIATSKVAADWIADQANEKLIGEHIGRYEVIAPLGFGGMGEVFLAQDASLDRKIALKLLPRQFTRDPDRLRRFEREARAVSTLNHPNIITIYEIGQWEGTQFIATEFIEGETLRERMAKERLRLADVLEIGAQIASALAAAHNAGIIHRDIKPANIMVRSDGYAKVLDFGLAKLATAAIRNENSEIDATIAGRVMGTVSYMSPEQALGEALDHRTDIFSLGVVLYEMATGSHPFQARSEAGIYNAILNKTPTPLAEADPSLPPEMEQIVERALEKNRERRYQSAGDLRADLRRLEHTRAGTTNFEIARKRPRTRTGGILIAAGVAAALVLSLYLSLGKSGRSHITSAPIRNASFAPLTNQPAQELSPSLSPDGKLLVYASNASGNWDIYFQRVGGNVPVNLTQDSPEDDIQPSFSPDGDMIAFRSSRDGGGIFVMGATGENVKRITDFGFHPAWSPDGKEIVCAIDTFRTPSDRTVLPSRLTVMTIATGEKRELATGDAVQPNWSPHGTRIAYWGINKGGQRDIWTVPARGGETVQVTDDAAVDFDPVWSPDGKFLWFASDRGGSMNLWRVAIDEQSGKLLGPLEAVTTPSTSMGDITFSRDGRRLAYAQTISRNKLQQVAFDPESATTVGAPRWITQGSRLTTNPDLSPDGTWLAFDSVGEKQEDIFLVRPDGSGLRQLTNDGYKDRVPRWSADGQRIAFFTDRSGRYETWTIHPDGSDLRQITYATGPGAQIPLWSPTGSKLLISNLEARAPFIIDVDKPWSEQTSQSLRAPDDPDERFLAHSWSPDGRQVVGTRRSASQNRTGIVSYSFETQHYDLLSEFGDYPVWLNDNRRLLFMQGSKVYLLDSLTKQIQEIFSVGLDRLQALGLSHDNRAVYYSLTTAESDIWMMTME